MAKDKNELTTNQSFRNDSYPFPSLSSNDQLTKTKIPPSLSLYNNNPLTKYYFLNYIDIFTSSTFFEAYENGKKREEKKSEDVCKKEKDFGKRFLFLKEKLERVLRPSPDPEKTSPSGETEETNKIPSESELYFMCREPHVFIILGISRIDNRKGRISKRFLDFYGEKDVVYEDLTRWSTQQKFTRHLRSLGGVMRKIDTFLDFKELKEKDRLLSREDFEVKASFGDIEKLKNANWNTRKPRRRPIRNKINSIISSALIEEGIGGKLTDNDILAIMNILKR